MGNDDEALWGRNAVVVLPLEPAETPLAPAAPPDRSRRITVMMTVAALVGVAVVVAVLGRTTRPPTPAEVKVVVRHERFTVTIEPALQCAEGGGLGPTADQSMVIDTWTDGPRRRVHDTITYADGSRYDLIATGNISLPSAASARGVRADLEVGCLGTDGTPIAVVTPPDLPFALDFSLQVTPEQRSAFAHFHQQASDGGTTLDADQRLVTQWIARARGTWSVDAGTNLVGHQEWQWSIGVGDPHTVRRQQFTNTVERLGTATRTETLELSEDTAVPAAFFDTTGYRPTRT
jgi:hypothetical protein